MSKSKKQYSAHVSCSNCDYKTFPEKGNFEKGKLIKNHICPNCGCFCLSLHYIHIGKGKKIKDLLDFDEDEFDND